MLAHAFDWYSMVTFSVAQPPQARGNSGEGSVHQSVSPMVYLSGRCMILYDDCKGESLHTNLACVTAHTGI